MLFTPRHLTSKRISYLVIWLPATSYILKKEELNMNNEILLFPNNIILVNALYHTSISYNKQDDNGIFLNVKPISANDHIEDDLDIMEDIAEYLFQLYLKDPKIAAKIKRPRYYYNDMYKRWIITFEFK
nr:MAG TPA: hypothetical protein [Caudoviricetes sp.]